MLCTYSLTYFRALCHSSAIRLGLEGKTRAWVQVLVGGRLGYHLLDVLQIDLKHRTVEERQASR